jgi:adenylate cyclase
MPAFREDPAIPPRARKVIAVADVVESVRLMEQHEQEFIRLWQRFVGFVQEMLPTDSGRLHKSLGDGLMLEFGDAEGCLHAARTMRSWFSAANEGLAPEDQVHLRIGAHVAQFVADAYDIYGTDVNLAARIAGLAGPGEIVVSAALREVLGAGSRAELEDLGPCHLKHLKDPVQVFRVGHAGRAPVMPARRLASHSLRPTMAVLPFALHGDGAGELTGEALADDSVAALSRSELLQVVSRLSTTGFAADRARLQELRRTVAADYVLTGRGQRHGVDLTLFMELADAATGHVVWANSLDGPQSRAAPRGGQLMRDVVGAVHAAVIAHEMDRAQDEPLPALAGHTLLLGAIGSMHRLALPDLENARRMLEHLVERGRGHLAPHAWLAHLHVLRLRVDGTLEDARREAHACAAAAMRCDPGAPLALCMQGQASVYAAKDLAAAEDCYAEALAARPGDSLALLLHAEVLALQGRGNAAVEAVQQAGDGFALEPMHWLYDAIAALASLAAGDPATAAAQAGRAWKRNPRYLPALRTLAVAQVQAGDVAQARQAVQRWLARDPQANVASVLATCVASASMTQLLANGLRDAGLPA